MSARTWRGWVSYSIYVTDPTIRSCDPEVRSCDPGTFMEPLGWVSAAYFDPLEALPLAWVQDLTYRSGHVNERARGTAP
jgi:hypothetical protein